MLRNCIGEMVDFVLFVVKFYGNFLDVFICMLVCNHLRVCMWACVCSYMLACTCSLHALVYEIVNY